MFLSKVSFSPSQITATVRQLRSSPYKEHQMIWNLFNNTTGQQRDFLYRREDVPGTLPFFYLLSTRKPSDSNVALDIETKSFHPTLLKDDHLAFSLRANAVITRKENDQSKKRIRRDIIEAKVDEYRIKYPKMDERPNSAMIHSEAAKEWLDRQGTQNGFRVDNFFVENHQYHKVNKPGDKNIRQFNSLDFHGKLIVTDEQKFLPLLLQGVGRSKAFGCGLLLIRRV
jgi:CRISPR system Cascade subunit CasE